VTWNTIGELPIGATMPAVQGLSASFSVALSSQLGNILAQITGMQAQSALLVLNPPSPATTLAQLEALVSAFTVTMSAGLMLPGVGQIAQVAEALAKLLAQQVAIEAAISQASIATAALGASATICTYEGDASQLGMAVAFPGDAVGVAFVVSASNASVLSAMFPGVI
jgi:hypothetical protein